MLTLDLTMKLNVLRNLFEAAIPFDDAIERLDAADHRADFEPVWRKWEAFNEGLPF